MYNSGMKVCEIPLTIVREDGKEISPEKLDKLQEKIIDLIEDNGYVLLATVTLLKK